MAVILDEEEERRLHEEEARLLAEQEAISLLPQTAIPADNVAFTDGIAGQIQIDPPADFAPTFDRQMIGDERYQQEVARARAGSGFIAGYGDTQTYDPAIAEAAQRREQDKLAAQAERFMGVQGYQQSLKSGAAPAEALALWGQKMFKGDPGGYASLVTRREPLKSSLEPEVRNVDGVKMYRTGPNSFAQARPEIPAKPPPETVAGQKILTGQITDARNALERAEKAAVEAYKPEASEINAVLRARSKLRGLEENFMRGSTNWMDRPAPTKQAAAPAKASDEQVVVTKDGRRYSLPKSQLEEALKAGYKQSQ